MRMSRIACAALLAGSSCLATGLMSTMVHADSTVPVPKPLPTFRKIVLVIEENQSYGTIIGNSAAPYTNYLAKTGALLTESYGTEHPSQPNYLDLFSGSDQNVYDDNIPTTTPFSGENFGAELLHKGLSFGLYSEDLPYVGDDTDEFAAAPGDPVGTHDYARKHNPVADWQNDAYTASAANPASNYLPSSANQPFEPFSKIMSSGDFTKLPAFSIVVPNQQHDDHGITGGASGNQLIPDGDKWLQAHLSAYAQWAKDHDSLLIVTWDEDDYSSINRIPTLFYGSHIKTGQYSEPNSVTYVSVVNGDNQPSGPPNYQVTQGVNHWNVLRTLEDIYQVNYCGSSNRVATISDIFEAGNK